MGWGDEKSFKAKWDKSHKKKRKILNLKTIRSKIVFGFTVVIVLVAIVGISTSLILKTMQNNTKHMINEQLTILLSEEKLQSNILERISLSRGYVLFGYPSYKERFEELTEESKKLEQEVFEMSQSSDLDYLISQSQELETYVQENIFSVYDQGDVTKAANNLSNVNSISERITNGYSELLQKQEEAIINNGTGLVTLANVA